MTALEKEEMVKDYEFMIFLETFGFNMDLLNYKLNQFEKVNAYNKLEYYSLFDSIIVQIRAILLEKKKSNFTVQSFFRYQERDDVAEAIDNYLDQPFNAADLESMNEGSTEYWTIRSALKFIADKFICHYDKVTLIDKGNADYICAELNNPYSNRYLKTILSDLISLCKKQES